MSAFNEAGWYKVGTWHCIDACLKHTGFVNHHFESYHQAVDETIPAFVENFPPIVMKNKNKNEEHTIQLTNFKMKKAYKQEYESEREELMPNECRISDYSYSGRLYMDIVHTVVSPKGTVTKREQDVPIGELPIMVYSNKCHLWQKSKHQIAQLDESRRDHGGYFILKGGERVLVAQEAMSPNYVHVSVKDDTHRAEIRSANESGKTTTTKIYWTENKKVGKVVRVDLAFIKETIPIVTLFQALGVTKKEDILNYILLGNQNDEFEQMLAASFEEMDVIKDQETALYFISMRSISDMKGNVEEACEKAKNYLRREFLPHIADGPMWEIRKAYTLGYIVRRLLLVIRGDLSVDDRDSYKNKRIQVTGPLITELFQDRFKKMVSDLRKYIHNCFEKGNHILFRQGVKTKYIKTGIANAMKTGNWNPNKHSSSKGNSNAKNGVSQVLNRLTPLSTLSHMRRINTPMGKEGTQQKARQLHNTQWGTACIAETPEGGSCLTLDTLISVGNDNYVPIGKLKNGDIVETVDPMTLQSSLTQITNYFVIQKDTFVVSISDGTKITATGDHPFFTQRGWVNTDELTPNDMVLKKFQLRHKRKQHGGVINDTTEFHDNSTSDTSDQFFQSRIADNGLCWYPINSVSRGTVEYVADFTTVSDNHTFVANGIVTHNCGLVKNIPLLTLITTGQSGDVVVDWLYRNRSVIKLEELLPQQIKKQWKIKVNGAWLGILSGVDTFDKAKNWIDMYKQARRDQEVYMYSSICWNVEESEIEIFTDAGRPVRPVYVVKNGKLLFEPKHAKLVENGTWSWNDLLKNGIVEYLDTAEQTNCPPKEYIEAKRANGSDSPMSREVGKDSVETADVADVADVAYGTNIAMFPSEIKPSDSHCEMHPAPATLGVAASIIPFPDHNQSPRNTYQSAMGKQAVGVYSTSFLKRPDTIGHILAYPQKPIVSNHSTKLIGFEELPAGTNVTFAFGCFTGYNQEDSIIVNQSAIDRGLFRSFSYRTSKEEEKKNSLNGDECFEIPKRNQTFKIRRTGAYGKLEEDGFVCPGTRVVENDVIIGKTAPYRDDANPNLVKRDHSTALRKNEVGVIDQVFITTNEDGLRFVKVKTRQERIPQVGDKLSSRHGQKGTIGMVYREEDMPYSASGMKPDVIINTHALPSRMTVGQLIECLLGKVCCIEGVQGDSTPFTHDHPNNIAAKLEQYGFSGSGNEVLFNGMTGKSFKVEFFMGPVFYQRLKHMVKDKIHARSTGPINKLTRQPVEGRAREGGLRFGELFAEKWKLNLLLVCVMAGNTIKFRESLDCVFLFVCVRCGV